MEQVVLLQLLTIKKRREFKHGSDINLKRLRIYISVKANLFQNSRYYKTAKVRNLHEFSFPKIMPPSWLGAGPDAPLGSAPLHPFASASLLVWLHS